MNIVDSFEDWCDNLPNMLTDGQMHIGICEYDKTIVGHGWENDIDREYCRQNNIPILEMNRNGGTIVFCKGAVGSAIIYSNKLYKEFVLVHMASDFVKWLQHRGLRAELKHNDILIDGYKVGSGAGYNLPPDYKMTYECLQVSLRQDIDAIQNICRKPMVKMPKGLSEYGITTQEVKKWMTQWLSRYLDIEFISQEVNK